MIFSDFSKALGQMGDPRFRRVLVLGLGLTIGLLVAVQALVLWAIRHFAPDAITLPLIGTLHGLNDVLGWGSGLVMVVLSLFLMVPVASAFSGFFLEDVAQAVEDRHYPGLPPVPRLPLWETAVDSLGFLALMLVLNLAALVVYLVSGPFAPLVFWGLNGFLLGREYFTLAAMRRLGRPGARAMRARHFWEIWLAGVLMAAPLSVPIVNLLVPVLGAATFTHLFHRLNRTPGPRGGPGGA